LYPDLVAIGILFGYGIKAILIPVFVICEQDIPQKKKKKKKKEKKKVHMQQTMLLRLPPVAQRRLCPLTQEKRGG
jgi:hypothetical protein